MHLLIIILLVAALYLGRDGSTFCTLSADARLVCTVAGMGLILTFARMICAIVAIAIDRNPSDLKRWLKRFQLLRRCHTAIWFTVTALVVFGLDWPQLVRGEWGLASSFLIDDLLIMLPVLLPLFLSWNAFYDVHRATQIARAGIDGRPPVVCRRSSFVGVQFRHYLGLIIAPLLIVLACYDTVQNFAAPLGKSWQTACELVCLLVCILTFPAILGLVWRTTPLPAGPLRDRLGQVGEAMGVKIRNIMIWQSENMITNAAVTGLLPTRRYVYLSDGMLSRMDDDQIVAVYAHELAHARNRHLSLRLTALLAGCAVWQASLNCTQLTQGLGFVYNTTLLTLVAVGLLAIFAFYCRALELQADLCASAGGRTEAIATALLRLKSLAGDGGNGWLHPTVDRRVAMIRTAAQYPAIAVRFHRRLAHIAAVWILIVFLGVAWWWLPA